MRKLLWLVPGAAFILVGVSLVAARSLDAQGFAHRARLLHDRVYRRVTGRPGRQFASQDAFRRQRMSPHEDVSAVVDGATVTVVYGRPSMRGRQIFGSLIRYGEVWCPGADEATTIESTRDLQIGAMRVPAGPHTIWMRPSPERWTLIVSKEPYGFHTDHNAAADLGNVVMRRRELLSPVEQLTFAIAQNPLGGGTLLMSWENTEVSVPFTIIR